jgi:hypothetical protein
MREQLRLASRYRLDQHVGAGGMSSVWRGYDEVLRRTVAVKVLNPEYVCDPDVRASVYREAQAVALLTHPHIAGVFDYGESQVHPELATPFVVMEFVAGRSLSEVLAAEHALPWSRAGLLCAQVASALAAAHAAGVVHRDVKPSNVMVGSSGAKVVDFGIAALVGETDWEPDGNLLGTPAYVAPERLQDGRAETAADVYAFGLLLYRTVAGQLPWTAETVTQMLTAHRYLEPLPLSARAAIPDEARELCEQCLSKDPRNRPTSQEAADILVRLAGVTAPTPALRPARVHRDDSATVGLAARDATQPVAAAASDATQPVTAAASDATQPVPAAVPARPIPFIRRRAVRLVAGAAGAALLVGALAGGHEPVAVAHVSALPVASDRCVVRYVVQRQWADGFDAHISVSNAGRHALPNATLRFAFSADQSVSSANRWIQTGRDVSGSLTEQGQALAAGGSVDLTLSGTYHTENLLPTVFYVGTTRCEASVAASLPAPVPSTPPAPPAQPAPAAHPAAPTAPTHDKGGSKHPKPPKDDGPS